MSKKNSGDKSIRAEFEKYKESSYRLRNCLLEERDLLEEQIIELEADPEGRMLTNAEVAELLRGRVDDIDYINELLRQELLHAKAEMNVM